MKLQAFVTSSTFGLSTSVAWAKSRSTAAFGGSDSADIVIGFWSVFFALGALALVALLCVGAVLAVRGATREGKLRRAMRSVGRKHGLRFDGRVFKNGYGRRAPVFCPKCLSGADRLVALQEQDNNKQLIWRLMLCPACGGSWDLGMR